MKVRRKQPTEVYDLVQWNGPGSHPKVESRKGFGNYRYCDRCGKAIELHGQRNEGWAFLNQGPICPGRWLLVAEGGFVWAVADTQDEAMEGFELIDQTAVVSDYKPDVQLVQPPADYSHAFWSRLFGRR